MNNIEAGAGLLERARGELGKRIVGQKDMVDGLLTALIAGGHVLLEGAPGLGKTRAVKALSEITGLEFKRVQFTPDLLPADLTGTLVWEQAAMNFSVRKGPVFANLILADEINRAPAKVQSALLEAMEEGQVTIGETSYRLPEPFFVMATQNPIEHEGTYPLPEAELDRFLMKLLIPYPSIEEEEAITALGDGFSRPPGRGGGEEALEPVLAGEALGKLRAASDEVFIDPKIVRYLVSLVSATRPRGVAGVAGAAGAAGAGGAASAHGEAGAASAPDHGGKGGGGGGGKSGKESFYRYLSLGASPRASIALRRLSRIRALFEGRAFVTPEDVKAVALPALRHRVALSYEAEAEGFDADQVIGRILSLAPIP